MNKTKKNVNPKSLKNLKPFPKGNRASTGRPKLSNETKQARELLKNMNESIALELIESGEYMQLVKEAIRANSISGKFDGIKFVNDYTGNKPPEQVQVMDTRDSIMDDLLATIQSKQDAIKRTKENES